MINILFVTGKLNCTDGVTTHLFNLTNELKHNLNFNMMILCPGGDSVNRFRDSGIKVTEDNIFDHANRSINNFSAAVKRLISIISRNQIDIIHSHNHYAANISYYASKFRGVKTVQTIHGLIPEGGMLKHFRADKYIAVNKSLETFLQKNKIIKSEDIKFINQGYRYDGVINKKEGTTDIICASRLIHEKGVDLYIRAAKIVQSRFSGNVKFYIAGTGVYEDELKKLATDINSGVVFLGEVKNLPELFSQTNIFIMPTRSCSEGLPMTIAEAAATKNLIITSEFNFFGNFFKDGADGFIFKVDDYGQLAEKILTALRNPTMTSQMTEAFYNKSKTMFDPDTMAVKHIELYKECLQA
ncbi:MAG: glycosyltransferase family 4 protein [Ignavibacteria bacterium]|nr:glycosyltransferase family 4 protein [Ignavibacteria bacterium]